MTDAGSAPRGESGADAAGLDEALYAEQLARGHPLLRFVEPLESEFRRFFRRAGHRRAQIVCATTILLLITSLPFNIFVLQPPPEMRAWSTWIVAAVLLPVMSTGLVVSWFDRQARYTHYVYAIGLLITAGSLTLLRYNYERNGLSYPFQIETLIAMAIFLFPAWRCIWALVMGLSGLGIAAIVDLLLNVPRLQVVQHAVNLFMIGAVAAVACYVAEHSMRMNFLYQRLRSLQAANDPLTGLLNRRSFNAQLARVWREAQREQRFVGVLMADVDHFKQFNDHYGHPRGDEVIRAVARTMREQLGRRPLDLTARVGGEEFAAVCYDVEPDSMAALAERFRDAVAKLAIPHAQSPVGTVTISCGYLVTVPAHGDDPLTALRDADAALYESKKAGRNRVTASSVATA